MTHQSSSLFSKISPFVVVLLLFLLVLQAGMSMEIKSATYDETAHLPAGYTYWVTGDFKLNSEHPPLIKLLASFPLLFMDINLPLDSVWWKENRQWEFGKLFLFQSGNDADQMLFWGRVPIVFLSLLLGFYVFLWARDLYGTPSGLLALFLYVFSPNILAHSRLITTDLGLSCFMFMACYHFWRYLERPALGGLVMTGLALGLALATKFSAIMLFPIFAIMLALKFHQSQDEFELSKSAGFVIKTVIIPLIISALVIYCVYGFRGDALLLYKHGLEQVYQNMIPGYDWYFWGEFSPQPRWYYYLFAFLIKTPIATLLLLTTALLVSKKSGRSLYENAWLIFPIALILATSFLDKGNFGIRRILPAYPFIFVLMGKVARFSLKEPSVFFPRLLAIPIITLLMGWYLVSSIKIYPDYLTYFNEIAGGPAKGSNYLDDSNIDWGQDLKRLETLMQKRGIREIKLKYWGKAVPEYYGIQAKEIPYEEMLEGPRPGYYALSIHSLIRNKMVSQTGEGIDWLTEYKPIEVIGHTIYVYRFNEQEALTESNINMLYATAIQLQQKGELKISEKILIEIRNLNPNYRRTGFLLGWAHQSAGRITEAISTYRKYLSERLRDIQAHFNLAYALMNEDQCQEAIDEFKQTLKLNPDYLEVHLHLSTCYKELGKSEEAEKHLTLWNNRPR